MEHNFTIKDALFLILLLAAIVGLFAAVISIYDNKEMLSNPLGYNLDKFGLTSCTCYDTNDNIIQLESINKTGDVEWGKLKS